MHLLQAPLIKVGKVCRDEGASEYCMRGLYATRDIEVLLLTGCPAKYNTMFCKVEVRLGAGLTG